MAGRACKCVCVSMKKELNCIAAFHVVEPDRARTRTHERLLHSPHLPPGQSSACGGINRALTTLREELTPLAINPERLRSLASAVLLQRPASVLQGEGAPPTPCARASSAADEPPVAPTSPTMLGRMGVLRDLRAVIPPHILLPEQRLEALVEQALLAQIERCPHHNTRQLRPSLLADYACGKEQLPTATIQVCYMC